MTAELIERNQTPNSAAELLQLPVHEFGTQTPESLIDPSLSRESRTVLQRYINGLNVAKQAPSRVERIAKGIVHEVVTMTPEKAGKIAKNVVTSYIKNVNPANFIKEDWYWRGGVGLGVGIGTILTVTGARVNPWIRTSVCLGLSAGFEILANIDYKNAAKKLDKLDLSDAERAEKLAELEKIKTKAIKIKKGMSAGLAYLGFLNMAEAATGVHFIEEGAKAIDWTKAQIGEVLTPKTAYAAELTPNIVPNVPNPVMPNGVPMAVADEYTQIPTAKAGFEVFTKAFGTEALDKVTNDHVSSTVGLAQAHIAEFDYGIKGFDPNNVEHLKIFEAESQADPDYQNKIKAFANRLVSLNQDKMDAFIDEKTGQVGDTFTYVYEDNTPIQFNTYRDWTQYFHSGEYQHDINGRAHLTIDNGYKEVAEPFQGEDPVFKNMPKEVLGIQDTGLEPGQVSSIHGLAQARYAKDYLGIKDFDPINNDDHQRLFWEATSPDSPLKDPLYEARIDKIAQKFIADNPDAVLYNPQTGEATDLFQRVDFKGEEANWKMLKNYHDFTTSLVNEGPVQSEDLSGPWEFHTFSGEGYSLRGFAEGIFIKEDLGFAEFDPSNPDHFEIVKKLIVEKYGNDSALVERKIQTLIKYIKENNPEAYFKGDEIVNRSSQTQSLSRLKLLRNFEPILQVIK